MIFLGCDPGLSGAVAFYCPDLATLAIHDMPTLRVKAGSNKRSLDAVELARFLDVECVNRPHIKLALIEQAGSRPGEGTASAHTNGRNWGIAYGVLCAQFVPVEIVPPAVWKRAMKCPAAKDGARARAKQLLPRYAELFARVKDDGRAEAALIAMYAAQRFREREMTP